MTVTYGDYTKEQIKFAQKHNKKADLKVYTSPMENNRYHKEYCWSDGAMWCEITELITETVDVEVHGIKVKTDVELYRTEYWSTEAPSKYFFERA